MSINLISSSSESFLSVLVILLAVLNLFAFLLQFGKLRVQFIAFINQLSHLRKQHNIREMKSAVLMVVIEICVIFMRLIAHICSTLYSLKLIKNKTILQ